MSHPGPGPRPVPDAATPVDPQPPVDPHRPEVDGRPDRTETERRADMAELRGELGDTVEELTHRVDVPARVRARREETAERTRVQVARAQAALDEKAPAVGAAVREQPAVFAGALLGAVVALLLVRRRARRRR